MKAILEFKLKEIKIYSKWWASLLGQEMLLNVEVIIKNFLKKL